MSSSEVITFRRATVDDVSLIVAMLADDVLGREREDLSEPLAQVYLDAFKAIDSDANQELVVAEMDGAVVGTLQLTYIPTLSHRGSWRAQIESVRVATSARGAGLGRRMFDYAIDRARQRGCRMVQLTTDARRADARRFYESIGFSATHHGMKLIL